MRQRSRWPPRRRAGKKPVRTYLGRRLEDGSADVRVAVGGKTAPLAPRLDLFNHSPTGLNWGYGGSGPAQLALALLANALADDHLAVQLHQAFKWYWVARLPREQDWRLTQPELEELVRKMAR